MMNVKHIFITTSISVIFGVYSMYNIFDYLKHLKNDYINKIIILEEKIEESNKKYIELKIDFTNITSEINILSNKIIELENTNFSRYSNYNFTDSNYNSSGNNLFIDENINTTYESSELQMIEPNLSMKEIKLFAYNIFDDVNLELSEENVEKVEKTTFLDYDCIEIINDFEKNSIKFTPCSSRKNSFSNSEIISRSSSVSEVNWSGLTKKFLFG
jgi:hypothetical protein